MPGTKLEITCTACGAATFVRREPVYEGFKKVGDSFRCAACGHTYAGESDVPFRQQTGPRVFEADDVPRKVELFRADERRKNCRYCTHYVVNPFTQRCGLHEKPVQATDWCLDFQEREAARPPEAGQAPLA